MFHFVINSILVGAPLGQNLQPHTNRSGALFKCPISQNSGDCVQVITDGRRCKSLKSIWMNFAMGVNLMKYDDKTKLFFQ